MLVSLNVSAFRGDLLAKPDGLRPWLFDPAGDEANRLLFHTHIAMVMKTFARIADWVGAAFDHHQLFERRIFEALNDCRDFVGIANFAGFVLMVNH